MLTGTIKITDEWWKIQNLEVSIRFDSDQVNSGFFKYNVRLNHMKLSNFKPQVNN